MAGGFGNKGGLPWPSNSIDLQHFKKQTQGAYIIMGRNTWETLPKLKNRTPVVVSSKIGKNKGLWIPSDILQQELEDCWQGETNAFLIGGAKLLTPQNLKLCTSIIHTTIKEVYYSCDTYINENTLGFLGTLDSHLIYEDKHIEIREHIV